MSDAPCTTRLDLVRNEPRPWYGSIEWGYLGALKLTDDGAMLADASTFPSPRKSYIWIDICNSLYCITQQGTGDDQCSMEPRALLQIPIRPTTLAPKSCPDDDNANVCNATNVWRHAYRCCCHANRANIIGQWELGSSDTEIGVIFRAHQLWATPINAHQHSLKYISFCFKDKVGAPELERSKVDASWKIPRR